MLNDFKIIDDYTYYDDGFKNLQKYDERLSINDCIYLSIMEDYGIEKIVSFDPDFDNKEGIIRLH